MTTATREGPGGMYVEDLLSLLTIDSNGYLSSYKKSGWTSRRLAGAPAVDAENLWTRMR